MAMSAHAFDPATRGLRRRLGHVPLPRLLALAMALAGSFLPGSAVAQDQPCTSLEATQFDFWIGDWEVRTPDGTVAGHNSIEKTHNGCVLIERYKTPAGYAGTSLNIYDASRGVWHQTWVDVGGLLLTLEGGFRDGAMVLAGKTVAGGSEALQRITWGVVDGNPDRVRQLWETSADGGTTWTVAFDGLYVRVEAGSGSD